MSVPNTYDEIVAQTIAIMEDNTDEFASYIPTAIGLAENRLFRSVDIDFSSVVDNLTLTANSQNLTKPAGHRVTHNFYVIVNGLRQRLIKKTEDYLNDYWPNATEVDVPKYYADKDVDTWMIVPTPQLNYATRIECELYPTALSDSNQTNVYTTHYPDLLYYCTLSAMSEWMRDDERKAIWEDQINLALTTANNEGRRYRQDDNTNVNNPNGGRNVKGKNEV